MSEAKDPAIKLFGRTIPLPEIPSGSGESAGDPASSSGDLVDDGGDQNHASSTNSCKTNGGEEEYGIDQATMRSEDKKENGVVAEEEITNLDTTSRSGEESIAPSSDKEEVTMLKISRTEEEQVQNSQEKTMKKPDKILPCPRCNSMETKFCYYNNYNVNQPRHFCKKCQRYWTAGGAMRNVPVGAGRRKNKNSTPSHHRQITVPEMALQNPQPDLPNGVKHHSMNCNGTVVAFGSDTRLCESMASVLNLADKTVNNCTSNASNRPMNDDDRNNTVTSTQPMDIEATNKSQEQVLNNFPNFPPQAPYFPGTPWPYAWNPAQWSSAVPPPSFIPPGFTMPFYPAAAYWGCTVPGTWNIPWMTQPLSPNSTTSNSPTLGKHSREENMSKLNDIADVDEDSKGTNKEKCLWVPKTLRIDDLGEAAKASIWTTLGIKSNKADSINGEGKGIFKAFPSKVDEKDNVTQNSQVLEANPAAMSRSINFHETS